ncbi:MAG: TetR/AcrR family transcriptional regulator [Candidatus Lokiarchaeota archaeon]|nr:TetR/AcrR family transcriptional regulator [Candidatus Lokiarchaeota archaeon]
MSENKKEQILTAANECFAKFGYKKTTLEDIGEKIGLNKASIYYYFKNKEEIFTTIVFNEFQHYIIKLHQDIKENMNCEQKISLYFEKKLHYIKKSILLQQITEIEPDKLQHLFSSGQDIISKMEKGEKTFMIKILENCIKKGEIKDCNVEKVSELLFNLINGIENNYKGFTEFDSMMEDVQMALTIFINGLKK